MLVIMSHSRHATINTLESVESADETSTEAEDDELRLRESLQQRRNELDYDLAVRRQINPELSYHVERYVNEGYLERCQQ